MCPFALCVCSNSLTYFLGGTKHYKEIGQFLEQWFGKSPYGGTPLEGFEKPCDWEFAPECVMAAVKQLEETLIDPETGETLLKDKFDLGFAQFTRMPACKQTRDTNRVSTGLEPPSVKKRQLGAHVDREGYLEVWAAKLCMLADVTDNTC